MRELNRTYPNTDWEDIRKETKKYLLCPCCPHGYNTLSLII